MQTWGTWHSCSTTTATVKLSVINIGLDIAMCLSYQRCRSGRKQKQAKTWLKIVNKTLVVKLLNVRSRKALLLVIPVAIKCSQHPVAHTCSLLVRVRILGVNSECVYMDMDNPFMRHPGFDRIWDMMFTNWVIHINVYILSSTAMSLCRCCDVSNTKQPSRIVPLQCLWEGSTLTLW